MFDEKAIKSLQPVDEEKSEKPHKPNVFRWLALTGYAAQLRITIYASVSLGQWLDALIKQINLDMVCVLLGLFVSIAILLQQLKALNHD